MTEETQARFLASIAKQLPADRVIEAHLFGAIRQGGIESGVAVVVVALEAAPFSTTTTSLDVDGGYVPPQEVAEAAVLESQTAVAVHDQLADETAFVADEVSEEDSPYAPGPSYAIPALELAQEIEIVRAPAPRFTVYSARYRHTLKGLDRGKWEVNVTEEADAPLLTVDAVVRGVQRRSGDADEVVRLSGDEFRATLPTA
ncbi:hypothetical protein BH09GEM1_BH09GEM1_21140 [soil metagenome]